MKILKVAACILTALIVFVIGVLFFAPWENIGIYAFDIARQKAQESGIYLSSDAFTASGGLTPRFTMRTMTIDSPFAQVVLSNVLLSVFPFKSIASGGAAFSIEFAEASIKMISNIDMAAVGGRAQMTATPRVMRCSDISMNGDMQLSGGFSFNMETRKMIESSVTFSVPDNIGNLLKNPMLSRFLEQAPSGEWRIRYEAQDR